MLEIGILQEICKIFKSGYLENYKLYRHKIWNTISSDQTSHVTRIDTRCKLQMAVATTLKFGVMLIIWSLLYVLTQNLVRKLTRSSALAEKPACWLCIIHHRYYQKLRLLNQQTYYTPTASKIKHCSICLMWVAPHCYLTPFQRTPASIPINLILPQARVSGLHFWC